VIGQHAMETKLHKPKAHQGAGRFGGTAVTPCWGNSSKLMCAWYASADSIRIPQLPMSWLLDLTTTISWNLVRGCSYPWPFK
jgi:hypothetical protein